MLAVGQREAIRELHALILSGGPGMGKTAPAKALSDVTDSIILNITLDLLP